MKRYLLFIASLLTALSVSAKVTLKVVNETGKSFSKVIVYTERENGRHVWNSNANRPKFNSPSQTIDTMKYSDKLMFGSPKKVTLQFRTADEETDYFCFGVDLTKVKTLKINDNTTISCPNEEYAIAIVEAVSEDIPCRFKFENKTKYSIYAIFPFLSPNMQLDNLLDNDPDKRLAPNEHRYIDVLNFSRLSVRWNNAKTINLKFAASNGNGQLVFFDIKNVDVKAETVVITSDMIKVIDPKVLEQSSNPDRIEDADNSYFKFVFNEGNQTATVGGYKEFENPKLISIPAKVKKGDKVYDVVAIAIKAFKGMNSITQVKMPKSILRIGVGAFYECKNLTDLQIGDSVNYIENYAFANCSQLKKVVFPNTKLNLESYSFSGCKGVTYVYIPANMDTLDCRVFSHFDHLETLDIDKANKNFTTVDDIVYSKDKKRVLYCMSSRTKDVNILDGVEEISYGAFGACERLKKINIPKSVKKIAPYAFSSCVGVDTFIVPEGVKEIEEGVFSRCLKTRCIQLPSTITKIGVAAFLKCELVDTFIIPNGVTEIGEEAFRKCFSVDEIVLPQSLKKIGNRAFSMNSIRRISIPDGVTELPEALFQFAGGLEYVKLPNNITVIPYGTFDRCHSLKSITIPASVKLVERAFIECDSLRTVYIPASVDSMDNSAISECKSLEKVVVDENNKHYCAVDGILFNKDKSALLLYPSGKTDASYEIPKSVKRISYRAFSYNNSLTKVVIPKTIVDFDKGYNFLHCENLKSVVLPSNMTIIPNGIFYGCKQLTDIKIPSKVETIGRESFSYCPLKDKDLILPKTLKNIGWKAFGDNPQLESVVIPQGVESVSEDAFDDCKKLQMVKSPKNRIIRGKLPIGCKLIEY